MFRCTNCGREYDVGRCADCHDESVESLAERLLAAEPSPGEGTAPPREAPNPLLDALATEVSCPSCHTAIPPASRFCGVCGLRLATPPPDPDAPAPKTRRGPP